VTGHRVASREEWLAARNALLEREKELTRTADELARRRRELPWVGVETKYTFDTVDGTKTLAELFDGRSQLIAYNFMFGPDYEAGCPVCSSVADGFDGAVPHLNAKDVTFLCISRAPLERLQSYRERMGWSFPWVSSGETGFSIDFETARSREDVQPWVEAGLPPVVEQLAAECGTDVSGYITEGPVLTAFALEDGDVYHTYSTTARGLEFMMVYYGFLDRAPQGRAERDGQPGWLRRHDEYPPQPRV
jgi:predicted dithiol-disulfide oxidoreductase (DUF899 family)